jgi:predicted transcriptional regulator
MRIVWTAREIPVAEIQQALRKRGTRLALPSVRTMLGILEKKGYVSRERDGRGYAYRAVVSAEQAQRGFVRDLLERVFDGSAMGLVASILQSGMVAKGDLKRVKRLIEEHEKGAKS